MWIVKTFFDLDTGACLGPLQWVQILSSLIVGAGQLTLYGTGLGCGSGPKADVVPDRLHALMLHG